MSTATGSTVVTAASGIYDILPLNYSFELQVISSAPSYQEGRVTYSGTAGKGLFPVTPFYTTTPKLRDHLYSADAAAQLCYPSKRESAAADHNEHGFSDRVHQLARRSPDLQYERHQQRPVCRTGCQRQLLLAHPRYHQSVQRCACRPRPQPRRRHRVRLDLRRQFAL